MHPQGGEAPQRRVTLMQVSPPQHREACLPGRSLKAHLTDELSEARTGDRPCPRSCKSRVEGEEEPTLLSPTPPPLHHPTSALHVCVNSLVLVLAIPWDAAERPALTAHPLTCRARMRTSAQDTSLCS